MIGKVRKLSTRNKFRCWTLFLDRDGVINEKINGGYVKRWSDFRFVPGTLSALATLSKIFKRLIIVTNQRGIGLMMMNQNDLEKIHSEMMRAFREKKIRVDAIYVCPHEISNQCRCRKPKIGLFKKAQRDYADIDFKKSVVVGDSPSDWKAAEKIGAQVVCIGDSEGRSIPSYKNLSDYCRSLTRQ